MIVRWPGHTEPGTESQALLEYVDVAPTFLEAAGVPVPATMDGKSFVSVLNEPNREHKKYTYGIHTTKGIINGSDSYGIRSCGTKTHRYIRNLSSDKTFSNVFLKNPVWQEWQAKADDGDVQARRLTGKYQKRPAEELYDVVNDPHCLNNLVGQAGSESIRSELSRQLDDWMAAQGD
ncbi:MAG: sulfatase atsG, partial [Planctomycetaceae bacterium]|nr:sulfatase atsG [Planctomycetaceae bacterium]